MMSGEIPIDDFFAALNQHDLEALRRLLAFDFVFEEVAGPGEPSVKSLADELQLIYSGLPDITFRPVRRVTDDGKTIVEFRAIGTHDATFLSVPATGTTAIVSGVFAFEGSKRIDRLRLTVDFGGLRRQLLTASGRLSGA